MKNEDPILIVDDDAEDRELVKEALTELEVTHEILDFANGKEVIDYLKITNQHPFIILCDVNMPKVDGISLHHELIHNKELRKKNIPFIFFTTSTNGIVLKKVFEQPVQGFFEKPIKFNELKGILKTIIDYWTACANPNKSS